MAQIATITRQSLTSFEMAGVGEIFNCRLALKSPICKYSAIILQGVVRLQNFIIKLEVGKEEEEMEEEGIFVPVLRFLIRRHF